MRFLAFILLCFPIMAGNLAVDVANWSGQFYIGSVGDSIIRGAPAYTSRIDGGPSGDINADVLYRARVNTGVAFLFTNCAVGGDTALNVNLNQMAWVLPAQPKWVYLAVGINDIYNGGGDAWSWADFLTNLNAIRLKCQTNTPAARLIIGEIFPDGNATIIPDAKALIVRQWNTNLAIWAATCGVYQITAGLHDFMGTNRPSTSMLDDLRPDYDAGDALNVHLNTNGINAWSWWLVTNLQGWAVSPSTFGTVRVENLRQL